MPSTFFGLNIASSGLRNANINLNTAANNISNINTKGYSRQTVKQVPSDALRVFEKYGCAGSGVDTVSIDRCRDEFYGRKFRENEVKLCEEEALEYYNKILEDYLYDDGKSGFTSVFSNFQNSIERLITQGDNESKNAFISDSKELCEYFNDLYASMQKMQLDINDEIKICTDSINCDIKKIAELNKQINLIELRGNKANELRDKRDLIVDELSGKLNINVVENDIIDSNTGKKSGATNYQIFTNNGLNIIDNDEYKLFFLESRQKHINESDPEGLFDIVLKDKKQNVTLSENFLNYNYLGGRLQGLFEMRDGNNNTYLSSSIVSKSYNKIKINVDKDTFLYSNIPHNGKLTINNKEYDYSIDNYNNTELSINIEGFQGNIGDIVKIGKSCDYQGIPYYLNQIDKWVKKFTENINEILKDGYTGDNQKGCELFVDKNNDYDISTINGYNLSINEKLLLNPGALATKKDLTEGVEELKNMFTIKDFVDKKNIFDNAKSGEFLSKILSNVVLNSSNCSALKSIHKSLQINIENSRQSISGVDDDEEAANLMKYQNAYALNSKVIQTFSEMYDRLILETGV